MLDIVDEKTNKTLELRLGKRGCIERVTGPLISAIMSQWREYCSTHKEEND